MGATIASYHLDAWGNYRFSQELDSSKNRFGFTGYLWDKETSLFFAKARFYDPATARFTTQDSFLGNIDNPPSLHRYFYANDNPTRFFDPSGHDAIDYVTDAGRSLWGFGKGVASGVGNLAKGVGTLAVGAVVGTGKIAINSAKIVYGTPEMKEEAAHEFVSMGAAAVSVGKAVVHEAQENLHYLKQGLSDPSQILDAAAELGPEGYGKVIGGATVETALTATMFTGVGAAARAAQGAEVAGAGGEVAVAASASREAVVVGESRVAAATGSAEQAATRAKVLSNIEESRAAREASGFAEHAEQVTTGAPAGFESTQEYLRAWASEAIPERVATLRGQLGASAGYETAGVGAVLESPTRAHMLVASSEPYLRRTTKLLSGEELVGRGVSGLDAEMKIAGAAGGREVLGIGATRPVCAYCQLTLNPEIPIVTPRQPFRLGPTGLQAVRRAAPAWFAAPPPEVAAPISLLSRWELGGTAAGSK